MRGELKIDSVVGQGTTATLVLRCAEKAFAAPPVLGPPSEHGALDGSLNVLYAEDNEVNAELVRQVARLRPAIALRVAENGATALAMARQRSARPDARGHEPRRHDRSGTGA